MSNHSVDWWMPAEVPRSFSRVASEDGWGNRYRPRRDRGQRRYPQWSRQSVSIHPSALCARQRYRRLHLEMEKMNTMKRMSNGGIEELTDSCAHRAGVIADKDYLEAFQLSETRRKRLADLIFTGDSCKLLHPLIGRRQCVVGRLWL